MTAPAAQCARDDATICIRPVPEIACYLSGLLWSRATPYERSQMDLTSNALIRCADKHPDRSLLCVSVSEPWLTGHYFHDAEHSR